jgi:hypothetical protein
MPTAGASGSQPQRRKGRVPVRANHLRSTARIDHEFADWNVTQASQAFWQVDDVDREIGELKERGVSFEQYDEIAGERTPGGAVIAGGAKAAWFKDSEGNILALIEGA